ncbi:MAG: hypothetical protein DHS20C01_37760 [marine bacterium B5-7]|nr:MAG: hypothetical protein DHS20C01_37760 [marine bacterium B5-7]
MVRVERMGSMSLMAWAIELGVGDVFAQDVRPKSEPAFNGTIGKTYKDSKSDFPKPLQAPAVPPNVLIVLLDDVGFAHAGTFGGAVPSPHSTGSRRTVCARIVSTRPPFVRPHAPHCLPGAIITAWARA